MKVYLQKERNVPIQLARTQETLHRRLTAALGAGVYGVEALLYCPDYSIRDASIAGVAADRIVDASRKAQLAQVILQILPEDDEHFPNAPKLHHFSRTSFALTPDTSALVGCAGTLVTRLSAACRAARQLEFAPFRLRVTGTAGSGKTQLAVQAMRDAVAAGKRVLYVFQPAARRLHRAHRAARRENRELPPARLGRARRRLYARLPGTRRIRAARGALRGNADSRALALRRAGRR